MLRFRFAEVREREALEDLQRRASLADEVNYAGLRPTREEFARWLEFMRDALQRNASQRGTLQRGELSSGESP